MLVLRLCAVSGICTLRYCPEHHPGYGVLVVSAVYAGESSTKSTRECFLILFADAMKRNLTMMTYHPHWSFHDSKEAR